MWDQQIKADLVSGRLNDLIAKAELSLEVKEQAQKAYQWQENPLHPSLHFKQY